MWQTQTAVLEIGEGQMVPVGCWEGEAFGTCCACSMDRAVIVCGEQIMPARYACSRYGAF